MKEIKVNNEELRGNMRSKLTEHDACNKFRSFNLQTKAADQGETYFRTIIVRETIKNALALKIKDPKAVMEYMASRFAECGFKNYQQKQSQLLWDHRRGMRYLKWETRKPSFLNHADVTIGSKTYRIGWDVSFIMGDAIDMVVYMIGKPTVTQTGKSGAYSRDMQLYSMILAARQLGFKNITASFYFLKKTSDSSNWGLCDQNFFGGGGNIVTMSDLWTGEADALDEQMAPLVEMYERGIPSERVPEEECKKCGRYAICSYQLPPVRLQDEEAAEETTSAAKADVVYNDAQQAAIEAVDGEIRVLAGAGTGKTKMITGKVTHLLKSGVKPEEICCVTFTNSAAEEMRERIEAASRKELPDLTVTTFHGFLFDIVRENWQDLGFKRVPKVIDNVDNYSIIKELIDANPILEWTGNAFLHFTASSSFGTRGALLIAAIVFKAATRMKACGETVTPAAMYAYVTQEEIPQKAMEKLIKLHEKYEKCLKERGLITFDRMGFAVSDLIAAKPDYLAKRFKFKHIIIDEFQDTSMEQLQMIMELEKIPSWKSTTYVGDDWQSIYGWRDDMDLGEENIIVDLPKILKKPVTDIRLEENYRSTKPILAFAGKIIANNTDQVEKDLISARGDGMPVVVNGFFSPKEEMAYIAQSIKNHLEADKEKVEKTDGAYFAVLARTKAELVSMADTLAKADIPCRIDAPLPSLENSRILAILAFAKVICNRNDTDSAAIAANAVKKGTLMEESILEAQTDVENILAQAEEINKTVDDASKKALFNAYIDTIALEDPAVESFKETLENKDFDEIIEYCRAFEMYGDGVEYRLTGRYPEKVVLTTIHSSKGMEYPVVYVMLSKFHAHRRMSVHDREETNRLLFVAATRARDELYITGQYMNGTKTQGKYRNYFLDECLDIAAGDAKASEADPT